MTIQELVIEILQNRIFITEVTLKEYGAFQCLCYRIEGFYKSGGVNLFETPDGIFAEARYNEITQIESFEDLVHLNYRWWDISKERFEGWKTPDERWLPLLLERNLVKESITTNKTYQ